MEQTKQAILKRIERLNDRIELKIIQGKSYKKEAQEHKNLLYALRNIERNKF